MSDREYRTVKSSQTVLKELMVPSYANFGGKVHGGVILSLMDKIAYTCAASHVKGYCVTDRKSTRLNSSHQIISYAVFCLKKKTSSIL